MTDNQERAKAYLDKYRAAKADVDYCQTRADAARARAEGLKSANDVALGWRWEEVKASGPRIKRKILKKIRVQVTYPLEGHGTSDPHAIEDRFCELEEATRRYDNAKARASAIEAEVEGRIVAYCEDLDQQQVLRYRYLLIKSFSAISEVMPYSVRHVYRLHEAALEVFGKKLSLNVT